MSDIFRPHREPARTLYDVFQKEAAHRKGRSIQEWQRLERLAIWGAAKDYAQQYGLCVPTMDDIERAETCAVGHVDYGAKWAYGVAKSMGIYPPFHLLG